ncbi:MAG: prenyltransferase [Rhodoferax sp.]|nr:prenyltransferase [Rhodoferax sp.]MBK7549042.1 prenyltransferase [Rhodoferax sp.]MBP7574219.1 prenyltransferase [Rhodoferax sp.]MBP8135838.1 prenyltransferase [Rhodoferax sp.]
MPPTEPLPDRLANPWAKYFLATRPAFLSVTFVGSLMGLATAFADGVPTDFLKAVLTVFFALVAHAGANVVNDYYDALNGSDAANEERIFPFTGGSRFIQNGVLSLNQTRWLGFALLISVIPAGLWLTAHSAGGVFVIGLTGLLVAWAYSAPPLRLMTRGMGEVAIVAGWLMVVVGSDYVQRGTFSMLPLVAGVPFAMLVAAILFLNQFPDRLADSRSGKHTLVVRLGTRVARLAYVAWVAGAYSWLLASVIAQAVPSLGAAGFLAGLLSLKACQEVVKNGDHPARLTPAIKATIAAANLYGLLMAIALVCSISK